MRYFLTLGLFLVLASGAFAQSYKDLSALIDDWGAGFFGTESFELIQDTHSVNGKFARDTSYVLANSTDEKLKLSAGSASYTNPNTLVVTRVFQKGKTYLVSATARKPKGVMTTQFYFVMKRKKIKITRKQWLPTF